MTQHERLRAIEAVASTVRRAREGERKPPRSSAITTLADVVRTHGAQAARRAHTQARAALIQPIDPSAIGWDLFGLFEYEDSETHWTRWLASTLKPENGPETSHLLWRAFCSALASQGHEPEPCVLEEQGALASLDEIGALAKEPLERDSVDREVHDDVLGRTDIVVATPHVFVVVENKLLEGWHDTAAGKQAERYRQFALQRRGNRKIALVLLTNRTDFALGEYTDWIRVDYRSLARSLRRELRQALRTDTVARDVLSLWPALMTVAAIERHLLDLDLATWTHRDMQPSWQRLTTIAGIADYLQDEGTNEIEMVR